MDGLTGVSGRAESFWKETRVVSKGFLQTGTPTPDTDPERTWPLQDHVTDSRPLAPAYHQAPRLRLSSAQPGLLAQQAGQELPAKSSFPLPWPHFLETTFQALAASHIVQRNWLACFPAQNPGVCQQRSKFIVAVCGPWRGENAGQ